MLEVSWRSVALAAGDWLASPTAETLAGALDAQHVPVIAFAVAGTVVVWLFGFVFLALCMLFDAKLWIIARAALASAVITFVLAVLLAFWLVLAFGA